MRNFLLPLVAAAALALVPAAPSQAKANWLGDLTHTVQGQIYNYGYSPWWYGGYNYPTYSYSYYTLPWYYGYYYRNPVYYYNYTSLPWYYGYGSPYRAYWGGYRPWFWGGLRGWHRW